MCGLVNGIGGIHFDVHSSLDLLQTLLQKEDETSKRSGGETEKRGTGEEAKNV